MARYYDELTQAQRAQVAAKWGNDGAGNYLYICDWLGNVTSRRRSYKRGR